MLLTLSTSSPFMWQGRCVVFLDLLKSTMIWWLSRSVGVLALMWDSTNLVLHNNWCLGNWAIVIKAFNCCLFGHRDDGGFQTGGDYSLLYKERLKMLVNTPARLSVFKVPLNALLAPALSFSNVSSVPSRYFCRPACRLSWRQHLVPWAEILHFHPTMIFYLETP